ncbi:GHKL domain-containing protein [bacterium]|nr:GHKL domain-containing protein [bacterium]
MEASKEGTTLKLDPKVQELYARLEEEKRKNRQLEDIKRQNAQLVAKINQLENDKALGKKQDALLAAQKTKKKIAIQEQLEEQKIRNRIIDTKQKRIELLIDSLDDHEDLHEFDTKTIDELKTALDTLVQSRKKRSYLIKKLNDQNKELSRKNEDLLFTRDKLAHDLRSLMSSILSTLSLIDLGEAEIVEQLLPSLEAKCKVFMDLVVTLSENKIEKDFLYINDVVGLLNLTPYNEPEKIRLDVTGIDIPIFGDKAALYDVAQNLINNAAKYSGKSGDQLKIDLSISQDSSKTFIKIADNGKGIAREKSDQIFDLYNRADIDDGEGKGIGLFMVQKLIEGHNGTISYDNDYTEGAQFVITLPNPPQI